MVLVSVPQDRQGQGRRELFSMDGIPVSKKRAHDALQNQIHEDDCRGDSGDRGGLMRRGFNIRTTASMLDHPATFG
jgi:hypothetical protein